MRRAVAEEGAELVKGIHFTNGYEVITIKQANGLVREVPWDYYAVATPVMVEAMIQEMRIDDPIIQEATKNYCLNYIKEWNEDIVDPEIDGVKMDDLWNFAEAFIEGYEVALKRARQ